jgi:processive 1,2-diacylglycerol beta-glucosyltransferase
MLLVSPIPGQEERNADYLLEAGAAIKAVDAATLEFKLDRLLADRPRLDAMSAAARRIARPQAAADVVALISSSIKAST